MKREQNALIILYYFPLKHHARILFILFVQLIVFHLD